MKDVIVIGGGPVGLHFARCLAAEGFEVEVLEEHATPGEPTHCTGIVSADIFKRFSVPASAALNDLRTIQVYSPSGRMIRYSTEQTEAVVIDRCVFDRSLRDLACAAGATVSPKVRATGISNDGDCTTVACAGGHVRRARACVIATGSSYVLHRNLGIGFPPIFLNCAQIELPAQHPGSVEIHVGSELARRGFAWAVPVRRGQSSSVRIGIMCEGSAERSLRAFLPRLKKWGIPENIETPIRPRLLPLAPIRKTFANRVLVIGDAAGLVKPTTGGGVFYGMISAGLAANVLANALRRDRLDESRLSVFQKLWKERLMEEIEAQLTLRLLLQRLSDDEVESMFDLWLTDGLMPLMRKTAAFNHHRKLIIAMIRYPSMRKILFRRALS